MIWNYLMITRNLYIYIMYIVFDQIHNVDSFRTVPKISKKLSFSHIINNQERNVNT